MKKISNYEAHEIALHLIDGGWTSRDIDSFSAQNALEPENALSPEAVEMVFREIAEIERTVVNQFGIEIDFEVAANMMDDELREELHAEGIESNQEFFDRYAAAHMEKFGEEWELDKPSPQL